MIPFHHLQLFLGSPLDHTRFTTHDAVPFFALQSIMHNVTAGRVSSGTLTLLLRKFGHQRLLDKILQFPRCKKVEYFKKHMLSFRNHVFFCRERLALGSPSDHAATYRTNPIFLHSCYT